MSDLSNFKSAFENADIDFDEEDLSDYDEVTILWVYHDSGPVSSISFTFSNSGELTGTRSSDGDTESPSIGYGETD